jgi:hypothetical protein
MKKFLLGCLMVAFVGCNSDPTPVAPDANPVPSSVQQQQPVVKDTTDPSVPPVSADGSSVVTVPANKTISSQPAEVKCPPVVKKAVAKHVVKKHVKKHVKRHRPHKGVILVPKKDCDCAKVAPVPVAPGVEAKPVPGPSQVEKQPYQYWIHGEKDVEKAPPVGESEKDRCVRTGGWWNIAVPYCEYQMP